MYRCCDCRKREEPDDLHYCCNAAGDFDLGPVFCQKCKDRISTTTCGQCKNDFCHSHGEAKVRECCGLILCGYLPDKHNRGLGCFEKHWTETLDCGHETCNLYKEDCCRVCEVDKKKEEEDALMLKDKKLVEDWLKQVKRNTLKENLENWMKLTKKAKKSTKKVPKKRRGTVAKKAKSRAAK